MKLEKINFEDYEKMTMHLPLPAVAFSLCYEDNRDVLLIYKTDVSSDEVSVRTPRV